MKELKHKIVLASQSPRRQYLLKELGFEFEVRTKEVDEDFPAKLRRHEIPVYLCEKKAAAYELSSDELLITADTIVWVDNDALNKPQDKQDAIRMLTILSGRMHEVITAVCLKTRESMHSFYVVTDVYFKNLTAEEIEYYIDNYKPYDKAGAYGAQEWVGYIGVEKIHGSYFNVMGLPVKELYEELMRFAE